MSAAIPVPVDVNDPCINWHFFDVADGGLECWARYAPKGVDFAALEAALTQRVTNEPADGRPVAPQDMPALRDWLQRACFLRLLQRLWAYNERRDGDKPWDDELPWGIASQIYCVRLDWAARQKERADEQRRASSSALQRARDLYERRAAAQSSLNDR